MKNVVDTSREEGKVEGFEKGIEKGIEKRNYEIAKKMKEKGLPNSDIADLTGLNEDEINHL